MVYWSVSTLHDISFATFISQHSDLEDLSTLPHCTSADPNHPNPASQFTQKHHLFEALCATNSWGLGRFNWISRSKLHRGCQVFCLVWQGARPPCWRHQFPTSPASDDVSAAALELSQTSSTESLLTVPSRRVFTVMTSFTPFVQVYFEILLDLLSYSSFVGGSMGVMVRWM